MMDGAFDETGSGPAVFIIGTGPVGCALAARLARGRVRVVGLHGRDPARAAEAGKRAGVSATAGVVPDAIARAGTVIIAVRDTDVGATANALADAGHLGTRHTVLHTCGAWPARTILAAVADRVAAVGTLHPLVSLNPGAGARELSGVTIAIEGDTGARAHAAALAGAMGCPAVTIDADAMAAYHAGAAVASNALIALSSVASQLLSRAGLTPDRAVSALLPLLRSTVENIERVGIPAALTGPLVRGDVDTVKRHLSVTANDADVDRVYRVLAAALLPLAKDRGLDAATVAQLQAALTPPGA